VLRRQRQVPAKLQPNRCNNSGARCQ
jgi:hypothetical protein